MENFRYGEVGESPDLASIYSGRVAKKRGRKRKLRKWQKPEGMPKRPLSAYNIFFAQERKEMLKKLDTQDEETPNDPKRISFTALARTIGPKWKELSKAEKKPYTDQAAAEQIRYKTEIAEWQKMGLDPRMKKDKRGTPERNHTDSALDDLSTTSPRMQSGLHSNQLRFSQIQQSVSYGPSSSVDDILGSAAGSMMHRQTPGLNLDRVVPLPVVGSLQPGASLYNNIVIPPNSNLARLPSASEQESGPNVPSKSPNQPSSSLQELNSQLDNEEVGYLKSVFPDTLRR